MLISEKNGFVLLFTPKCASNSIEDMLRPYSDIAFLRLPAFRHTGYRQYEKHIKPYLVDVGKVKYIETICLIREPLSWLNSWYRFRARLQLRDPSHPKHQSSTAGIEFSEFVAAYMSPTRPLYANVGTQFDFVKNDKCEIGVDRMFLYENLSDFVAYMSDKVGEILTLGSKNISPRAAYKSKTAELIGLIQRRLSERLHLGHTQSAPKMHNKIPDELLQALRNFIPKDFELYESLKIQSPQLGED